MRALRTASFRQEIESELKDNILGFWMRQAPDQEFGGFRGRVSNQLIADPYAEKGIILNSRILWTFSRAFRVYGENSYGELARRAYDYIDRNFLDKEFGGVFWTVDHLGRPSDTRKRTYAQAFAIYGLSEYFLATEERRALETTISLFSLLEGRAKDHDRGGYLETFERNWALAEDQRLSPVDQDDRKSMNSHLHVLEAYSNLLRVSDSDQIRKAVRETLMLFINHIVDPDTEHFNLFFDEHWNVKSSRISFGHDIEGSWLLSEAANLIGDAELCGKVVELSIAISKAVYEEGLDSDGALFNEANPSGITDYNKDWWPQAEGVVGFLNTYQLTDDPRFLDAAKACWEFIKQKMIDRSNGEWYWTVSRWGAVDDSKPKIDQWKCPYHNGRMCFEAIARLDSLEGSI